MKLLEISEKVKSGDIKLKDGIGHCFNPIDEHILRFYKWMLECSEDISIEEKSMSFYYKNIIEKDYNAGEIFADYGGEGLYCFDCGEKFYPYLIDNQTLGLINVSDYYSLRKVNNVNNKNNGTKNKIVLTESNTLVCSIFDDKQKGSLTSEIEITSGNLIFKNYFKNEEIYELPKDVKYNSENSICAISGRKNLMQYLSAKNIGYGQMGNMSVSIFVKSDGSEIIISKDYSYNETDGEFEVKHKGFKNIGKISLEVWRWMCGDAETLKLYDEPMSDKLKAQIQNPKQVSSTHYEDELLAKVKAGRWIIEHYYDFQSEKELIYSRMYLKI